MGKVANSQVGVYLGYASRKGHSFLDARLFLPEQWFAETHTEKRQECGVPEETRYQTKPEIALDMLQAALERGELPCKWVAADELYGDSAAFRDGIADLGQWYFVEVSCSSPIWIERPEVHLPAWKGRGRKPTRLRLRNPEQKSQRVDALAQQLPANAWVRARIKEGTKGPLVCDFACLRIVEARKGLPGPESWLIMRRNLDDPTEIKYYLSNAPADIDPLELVRVSGMRWPIETCFENGKQEVGFGDYQLRSWVGWHHHMTLCTLAHFFLVRLQIRLKDEAPKLTLPQAILLLKAALAQPQPDAAKAIEIVNYYQRRHHAAYLSHRKRRLSQINSSEVSL